MKVANWPRYMVERRLAGGGTAFYWVPHLRDRKAGFKLPNERLGANFAAAAERASLLNELLDAWREGRGGPGDVALADRVGTVDWWHHQYFNHDAFKKLSPRTQSDYRGALKAVADVPTIVRDARTGAITRTGELMAASLSTLAVDKLYSKLRDGGRVNRQADYSMDVCRRAWNVVRRAHPGMFLVPVPGPDGKVQRLAINPFEKMIRAAYERDTAKPAKREHALTLAEALD